MDAINFCPFCDAHSHKISICPENMCFCRECNRFFRLEHVKMKCPKCGGFKIEDSDFPAPNGEIVFQCRKCMKMYSANEFFLKNKRMAEEGSESE